MKRIPSPFKWRHYTPDVILLCVLFKSAALTASRCGTFKAWYAGPVERGLRPETDYDKI
jgi:hypothetical protein